jgi:fibronectin type 3 domain-containing protein
MAHLESSYSTQVSAMASDVIAPAQVQNLLFSVTQGQVILTWDAVTTNSDASAIADLAGYNIYRKKLAGDAFTEIGSVASDVVTYTDNTMKDGASYIYAVAAFDNEVVPNEGIQSAELSVKTIPSVPQGLVTSAFDNKVVLDWTSVQNGLDVELNENLAGYNIFRSIVDGSGYANVGNVAADVEVFEDTSVINGNVYYYVITAFDNSL